MSNQLHVLQKLIGDLLTWNGPKSARDRAIWKTVDLYERLGLEVVSPENKYIYDLFDLSTDIFKLAKKEIEELIPKWRKEGGIDSRTKQKKKYSTPLFELSILHLKRCCQKDVDHNTVKWIPYCMKMLELPFVLWDTSMENELSHVLLLCSNSSQLHWVPHPHAKRLWDWVWSRIENKELNAQCMKSYVELAVTLLKNVDYSVFEYSPLCIVKRVFQSLQKSLLTEEAKKLEWCHSRKYSVVCILSYVVRRWGLEARDFILTEIFKFTENLHSLISVEQNSGMQSKVYNMMMIDDLIKLAMIDTVDGHRSISHRTKTDVRILLNTALCESWKSAHRCFSSSSTFTISEQYKKYLARWLLAKIRLDPVEETIKSGLIEFRKSKLDAEPKFHEIYDLTFGSDIDGDSQRCNAWNEVMQIVIEVIKNLKEEFDAQVLENIFIVLWKKRKSFNSEQLRSTFCLLLAIGICRRVRFGFERLPTIDSIFKYSLSLMPNAVSLPNAAFLAESILRYRAHEVPKEIIKMVWDTVSRTKQGSFEVVRLLSALISFTDFDENARFANDEDIGNWSLRKDIVEWLLEKPNAHCYNLIYQLCLYHPRFCYNADPELNDDELMQCLKQCKLISPSKIPSNGSIFTPPETKIEEVVDYVQRKLESLLASECTLPVFVIIHEFSLKVPEVSFDVGDFYDKLQNIVNSLNEDKLLQSVKHFTKWPQELSFPETKQSIDLLITYLLASLQNKSIQLEYLGIGDVIIGQLANEAKKSNEIRKKFQNANNFANFIKEFILHNMHDVYDMTKRFERYSVLLPYGQLMQASSIILKESIKLYNQGQTITSEDIFIINRLLSSTCIRNTSVPILGYEFNAVAVAMNTDNVFFTKRNARIYLTALREAPFVAQNIVRHLLEKGSWRLHVTALKIVMKNEGLLAACMAIIPNMRGYLKIYRANFESNSKHMKALKLCSDHLSRCQEYIRKCKDNGSLIDSDNVSLLFGCERSWWKHAAFSFWRLFETESAIVCEKLHIFAKQSIELGLKHRVVSLLNSLLLSGFRTKDSVYKALFDLTYKSIFMMVVKEECTAEILEMCKDTKLRYDLFQHRIKSVPAHHLEGFQNFEVQIAFSVENFLKIGIDSTSVDYGDYGLIEFYKQLNENLTEDAIRVNELRGIYIVDFLSAVWLQLPAMRPHIFPIIARFKHRSPAWSRFPQPPHVQVDKRNIGAKLQFTIYLKFMRLSEFQFREYAICLLLLLTSYDSKCRQNKTKMREHHILNNAAASTNILCEWSRQLSKEVMAPQGEAIYKTKLLNMMIIASSVYKDIAACTIPFLMSIIAHLKNDYGFAVAKLLECTRCVKDNQQAIHCLAECVDAIGLKLIARFEKLPLDDFEFDPRYYFKLTRLFLNQRYLTHAFAVANMVFDKLSAGQRNLLMIDRISLENIEKSEEMIELLMDIYVAEDNSIALCSLPPNVQNRPEVRKVMNWNSKEWLRTMSSDDLSPQELTYVQWMCGLRSNKDGDNYFDSILRCNFKEYPKIIDTPCKFIFFLLFHQGMGSQISSEIEEFVTVISLEPSVDEMRLMMIANNTANFNPKSVEEHVIWTIRDLRKTINERIKQNSHHAKSINESIERMVKLAELLVGNKACEAATLLLNSWEEELVNWKSSIVDIDLIRICKEYVTRQSGDPQRAELNLRFMEKRVGMMSDTAIAAWAHVLSDITFVYRNNTDEGIRILELALERLYNSDSVDVRLKLLQRYHSVCIEQLSKLEEHRDTKGFRMKQEAVIALEKQIQNSAQLTRGNSGDENSKRTMTRVRREYTCEKNDIEKMDRLVILAAKKAIKSAFDVLSCISQVVDQEEVLRASSLIVFPLIDVIYKYEKDFEVVTLLNALVKNRLPSKLWLCAASHLASKCFSVPKSSINRCISKILGALIIDYPYHVLHTVLMYEHEKNGSEVLSFLKNLPNTEPSAPKMDELKRIIYNMRKAHLAYREIAKIDVKDNIRIRRVQENGKTKLLWPSDLIVFSCALKDLPVPTITQMIGDPGDYSTKNIITWREYKQTFTMADGLSTPKIWEIKGSDEKWYKTVWKKDDVRQDVLVEQMFNVTNNILEKRMLRTYNVVPLDMECGVIEFCDGTVSLKELLCGLSRNGGLHQEYNPNEVPATVVSSEMKEVQGASTEKRREVFMNICKKYSPVFRHFFYKNFSTAHIWREKIASYRQSLATWSVVCYIVGLGDRHASNILFDQENCTFVHIDLGMILEYSKRTLPVPEQVPFRISRDLLDAILIEGIENGQLAEECTEIMEKLKENQKVILGVASALLRETMANFREAEQAYDRPSYISEMAIGRLREKLRGTDETVSVQSSNLQIRRLLREATNPDNLSRMFCGWMPYL